MFLYRESTTDGFHLLVVEREPGFCRLYVGTDGEHFCHYDSGEFTSVDDAMKAARLGFDPGAYLAFPWAPFKRKDVIEQAPHGFDLL